MLDKSISYIWRLCDLSIPIHNGFELHHRPWSLKTLEEFFENSITNFEQVQLSSYLGTFGFKHLNFPQLMLNNNMLLKLFSKGIVALVELSEFDSQNSQEWCSSKDCIIPTINAVNIPCGLRNKVPDSINIGHGNHFVLPYLKVRPGEPEELWKTLSIVACIGVDQPMLTFEKEPNVPFSYTPMHRSMTYLVVIFLNHVEVTTKKPNDLGKIQSKPSP